jgi:hypothetical protein
VKISKGKIEETRRNQQYVAVGIIAEAVPLEAGA